MKDSNDLWNVLEMLYKDIILQWWCCHDCLCTYWWCCVSHKWSHALIPCRFLRGELIWWWSLDLADPHSSSQSYMISRFRSTQPMAFASCLIGKTRLKADAIVADQMRWCQSDSFDAFDSSFFGCSPFQIISNQNDS